MRAARHWSPAEMSAVHAAQAAGESALDISRRLGVTRDQVLGVIRRHRLANGIATMIAVDAGRKSVAARKSRGTFDPFRLVAINAARHAEADAPIRCEAVIMDGTRCGRHAIDGCHCLGHRYLSLREGERLRPPPRRVVSMIALREQIDRELPEMIGDRGRTWRATVPTMSRNAVSKAFSDEADHAFARLAEMRGWERLDAETYRQRRAA